MRHEISLIRSGERVAARHFRLDEETWRTLCETAPGLPLLGLWCDDDAVFALFLEADRPLLASTALIGGRYHALSAVIAPAALHERIAQDLWGAEPMNARDVSSLFDIGTWRATWPASARSVPAQAGAPAAPPDASRPIAFPPDGAIGAPLMALQARPWSTGLAGMAIGSGYAHRGIGSLLRGRAPDEAMRLIGRVSGAAYVAHPLAFSRAVERARGQAVSPALQRARAILGEIERISAHLYDLGRTARAANAPLFAAHTEQARETLAGICTAHDLPRRLTDLVAPYSVRHADRLVGLARSVADWAPGMLATLEGLLPTMKARLVGVGRLASERAYAFGIGGLVGRASGRGFDLRRFETGFDPRVLSPGGLTGGDAWARTALRLREIDGARQSLGGMAEGFDTGGPPESRDDAAASEFREGIGFAEGARGDIWYWVRLREGKVDAAWVRDPALPLLPLLPELLRGGDPETIAIVLASLGWSMSGAEL
ncbi:NADH-quinone oxidoreductase subunit D-related protein [Tanticharoenia sakaeratensis]|uniref:NADH-quinone oxidoreductase subunit D domain-containing protein n=1 Tax=Tanticharoenia sakaeratensis NBRC 103193 TaxID=1231623 RepID=A0A0D6MJQ4_9PROT|nr:hypothetical protein [Tanticharoenia sakaeratensis]GAN53700.1 hypothetical protein Tasa_010_247 [Tanticharoenia sakaeratensis NBRC 103193]GBQ17154.1 NADH-ubiquinone oxidoreductase 49kDa subunit [Tanticharoenia sakaeratensis NBRC 103193]